MTTALPRQPFPARLDLLPTVLDYVDSACATLSDERRLRIRIVVEELFSNAAKHGRPLASGIDVWLTLTIEPGTAVLCYEDNAAAFDPVADLDGLRQQQERPLAQRPAGGQGRLLVRHFADSATYVRANGRNRLELRFNTRS